MQAAASAAVVQCRDFCQSVIQGEASLKRRRFDQGQALLINLFSCSPASQTRDK